VRLVLDGGVSMAVWEPLAKELQQVLASSQALAQVTKEFLQLENLDAAIERERRLQPIADGQVIMLLISDTAGLHWWDRTIQPWLEAVGRRQPMAVIHTLPYRYRKATALRLGTAVTLHNRRTLAANAAYEAGVVRWRDPWAEEKEEPLAKDPPQGAVIPVITLDRREAEPWAAMVMGDHQARCPGVVLADAASSTADAGKLPPEPLPQDLLKGFQQLASPEAQSLMEWMAGSPAPLTLAVLRLLQGALRQQGNTAQPLAEVLISGLLERLPGQNEVQLEAVQFQILPEVRALLRKQPDPAARQTVLHLVTQVLERRWNRRGNGPSFEALITDPSVELPPEAVGLVHVANLSADMLDELPDEHFREMAARLRTRQRSQKRRSSKSSVARLQRLSESDLDKLIDDLIREGTTELILLRPEVDIPASADRWPESWRNRPVIYQLRNPVPGLAERLARLTQLTSLELWGNERDASIAASLAALTQRTSPNLRDNNIGLAGAASLAALTQLTSLNLENNNIGDEGAAALAALNQLTSLNLKNNNIGPAGAASLAALTQLTSLNLENNNIGDEGAAFLAALTQLTSLDLGHNEIADAGVWVLSDLTNLTSLSLANTWISDAGAASLAALTQLISLNLSNNSIGDAGAAALAALTQLTALDLWHNDFGDAGAAALAALTQLTSLDLGKNQIGDAGAAALAALTQLTSLNLSDNPVVGSTPFSTMRRLTSLNLKKTKIQDLSPLRPLLERGLEIKWKKFGFENGINVYNCPLIYPPPEIVKQGREAVLHYLREIDASADDRLYEAKMLILGDGGAGKTSLLRRLFCRNLGLPGENESIKGIAIHRHMFTNAAGRPFHLNVWDFNGQHIYHATHQFFITNRSLYVLVDDTCSSSPAVQGNGLKYWLEMIEALSDRSPVLIFQNEKAGRSKSIDEDGIKGRFPNVKGFYRGNLDHPNAAEALEEAILLHLQRLPHVGDAVPAKWLAIRAELEERKQHVPYVSCKEYLQIYGRHLELNETKALQLSQYLHDLGVFLHFQDDPLLARLVILQNDWATDAVFNVLDDELIKARSGYFDRADCQRIWAHSSYEEMHPELLALMEKFELCYKFPDRQPETWLVPQLLSPYTPEALKDWPQADDLVFTYRYDFLPKGLISRLMVRMHCFVREPICSWRDGAYFEHDQNQLLATISHAGGQEIELRARGLERKVLMSLISSELDSLNASFEGLREKVHKFVPCICSKCSKNTTPERYEVGGLLKRKQNGRLIMECPESYEDVSVLELLDGVNLEALPLWNQPEHKNQANCAAAERMYGVYLKLCQQRFGPDHPATVTALNLLAQLLHATNRLAEAEPMFRRALKIVEASYGEDHPTVATHLNNLARLMQATSRLAEAEPLMRRALQIDEASYGQDHPTVARDLSNLAQLLQESNRLAEAEPLMRRALQIDEASYGQDHPTVARDLGNLAQLLQESNRLAEAEPLLRRALKIDEASYGQDHPPVARDLNNLAALLQATNRLAEAEPLMRRALQIDEASHGDDHPTVATHLNNLAQLLKATNRLAEAEPLMRRALQIDEAYYSKNHPTVAIRLSNLALLLQATNRLAEAEPLIRLALQIDEDSYGQDHPNVAIRLNNLAALLQVTSRLTEAEPMYRRALQIYENKYGHVHPSVATQLNNLAGLLQSTNRLAEAEPLMRRALQIDEASYGQDHPEVARDLNNLATLMQATNRLAEAEPLMRRALQIDEASYGQDHPEVARDLNNLSQLFLASKRLAEAEPLMRRALKIDEASYGQDHPTVARDLRNLAQLLQAINRLLEAEPLMRSALKILFAFTKQGYQDPKLNTGIDSYVYILQSLGLSEEAIQAKISSLDDQSLAKNRSSGSPPHGTIKIFLASSSEVKQDRDAFELHFRRSNDHWREKGIYLQILRWETFLDAVSETRLQEEYNKEVRNCDIFVSLLKTKTGKYAEEEFDVAHRAFKDSGKPLIYTYFMETDIPNDKRLRGDLISLWSFQDRLSGLGHYPIHYTSMEDLLLQFQHQLDKLIEEGKI
jgi:Leucine-rich repeat (LRR) protein